MADRLYQHMRGARGGADEPELGVGGGALAGSVGANEAGDHPGGDPQVDLVDGRLVAVAFGMPGTGDRVDGIQGIGGRHDLTAPGGRRC
jgi:hypothetical protein